MNVVEQYEKWPEPQPGAGEGLGSLAGVGMYTQYDFDRKKHEEQMREIKQRLQSLLEGK